MAPDGAKVAAVGPGTLKSKQVRNEGSTFTVVVVLAAPPPKTQLPENTRLYSRPPKAQCLSHCGPHVLGHFLDVQPMVFFFRQICHVTTKNWSGKINFEVEIKFGVQKKLQCDTFKTIKYPPFCIFLEGLPNWRRQRAEIYLKREMLAPAAGKRHPPTPVVSNRRARSFQAARP